MVNMKQQKLSIAIAPECLNSSQHVQNLFFFFVKYFSACFISIFSVDAGFGIFLPVLVDRLRLYHHQQCRNSLESLQFSHLLPSLLRVLVFFPNSFCLRKEMRRRGKKS